jgi:hypothetical protein
MYRSRLLQLVVLFLSPSCLLPQALATAHTKGRPVAALSPVLQTGDYVWRPEASPAGPVVLLVSLPDQVLSVYRNGVRIGRSTVSTGKAGKRTPTGVFTVLQKKVDHTSSIYKGAKMPHMQRLTWSGIALHAGHLPGYPASAGCVRMPVDFAAKLYSVTTNGTTVIIADNKSAPNHTLRPGVLFSNKAGRHGKPLPAGSFVWQPEKAPKGPVSIIVSGSDREVYVYRNALEIGRAAFGRGQSSQISGSHVYSALATVGGDGRRDWLSTASVGGKAPDIKDFANRIVISPVFLDNVRALVAPGTTLILTNAPVSGQTQSSAGFNILTAESSKGQG